MGEELLPEVPKEEKKEEMPTDDGSEGNWLINKPKEIIVPEWEKIKEPGEVINSATSGDRHYVEGMLVRDEEGKLGVVSEVMYIVDNETETYKEDDESIRQPGVYKNPEITIRYPDGKEKIYKAKSKALPSPVYSSEKYAIQEEEESYSLSHYEMRGHDYRLGERVSFGTRRVGPIALIASGERPRFGIVGRKQHGKPGSYHLWMVDVNDVDYIEYDEKGAIKCEADNFTIHKPTLEHK